MNLRIWLLIAIIIGLIIKPLDIDCSSIIIILLIVQITLSMDGMIYKKESFLKKSNLLHAVMTCYVTNTVITLLIPSLSLM